MDNCTYNRPFDDQTQIKIALEAEAKRHIQRLVIENFITTDKPLLRHELNGIVICSPIQFLDYLEEE